MVPASPRNTSDIPSNRPARPPILSTGLALVVGVGAALGFSLLTFRGQRSEGFVRLSHRQGAAGKGDALRFELPAGWWVRYNGHQAWRGGTVVDRAGRPRIEVWLHEGRGPQKPDAETCAFPWGQVTCLTWSERMKQPFNSFPLGGSRDDFVVERAFVLDRGYLTFRVPADQGAELKSVIWECMRSLRPDDG